MKAVAWMADLAFLLSLLATVAWCGWVFGAFISWGTGYRFMTMSGAYALASSAFTIGFYFSMLSRFLSRRITGVENLRGKFTC